MRSVLAAAFLATALLVAGCGDSSDGTTATDPSTGSSSAAPSSSSTGKLVSVHKTCHELYNSPHQWMQYAIALVHGSPTKGGPTSDEIVAGLAEAERHAYPQLVSDIEITRAGVEAAAAGEDVDLGAFDKAGNRLANHCELYED